MAELSYIHKVMTERRRVVLDDGRTGKIIRLDTAFPGPRTTVSVWMDDAEGPSVAKVDIDHVVGLAPYEATG
jgi:hypothetical protein